MSLKILKREGREGERQEGRRFMCCALFKELTCYAQKAQKHVECLRHRDEAARFASICRVD